VVGQSGQARIAVQGDHDRTGSYEVLWKVRNTGEAAEAGSDLRGRIFAELVRQRHFVIITLGQLVERSDWRVLGLGAVGARSTS
jgi:hypothetical protein